MLVYISNAFLETFKWTSQSQQVWVAKMRKRKIMIKTLQFIGLHMSRVFSKNDKAEKF